MIQTLPNSAWTWKNWVIVLKIGKNLKLKLKCLKKSKIGILLPPFVVENDTKFIGTRGGCYDEEARSFSPEKTIRQRFFRRKKRWANAPPPPQKKSWGKDFSDEKMKGQEFLKRKRKKTIANRRKQWVLNGWERWGKDFFDERKRWGEHFFDEKKRRA